MSSKRKRNIGETRERLADALNSHEVLKAEYKRCAASRKKRPDAIERIRLYETILQIAQMLAEAQKWSEVNWTLDKLHSVMHLTP